MSYHWFEFKSQQFSFTKMHLKMLSTKWQPFCFGLDVLICVFSAFWSICNFIFLPRHEGTACTTVICLLLMSLVFPYWLYTIVRTFEHGIGHQVQLRTKRFDNFLQRYVLSVNDFVFVYADQTTWSKTGEEISRDLSVIKRERIWPPFCRRHFQTHFLEWKFLHFDSNFTEVCS